MHLHSSATHIVGGEMSYKHLGFNEYEITLMLYIDCFNGNSGAISQDQFANFSVFRGDSGFLMLNLCKSVLRSNPERVSKTNYNCIKISPDACVDAYKYIGIMSLPPIPGGYIISFQRCCRNNTIINLVSPLSTGENIWTHIADTSGVGYNSSPAFKNLPPNFLCTNTPLIFDHSAIDDDGDSLVYEFFHPYTGATTNNPRPNYQQYEEPPFSQVVFENGYGPPNPIPSLPALSLDRESGLLKLTPTQQGQFVVGILVKEYRDGKLIGATRRDYQFNVQNCVFETTSAFLTPSVNCNREIFFTNNSQNADSYKWEFGDTTTIADTSILTTGYYKYPTPGTFLVKLIAAKGNCVDSLKKWVTVFDRIQFKLPDDLVLCKNQTILVSPDTLYQNATYLWNNGSTNIFTWVSSPGLYWLNIKLGNCDTYDSIVISADDQVAYLVPDSLRCNTITNMAEARLVARGDIQTIEWKTDPNIVAPGFKDTILQLKESGSFVITGIKSNGCPYKDSVNIADFDISGWFRVPNVFTPNADGINDVFPEQTPQYKYKLKIFNRWGIEIYSSENSAWPAFDFPSGTYYYFIEMDACGHTLDTHGVIRVIR